MAARKSGKKDRTPGPFDALRALRDEIASKDSAPSPPKKPAPPPPRAPAPDKPEDEALLFHRLFAGVQPLDRAPGRLPKQAVERSASAFEAAHRRPQQAREDADAVAARLHVLVESGSRFEVTDDGQRIEGRRDDLPVDSVRRLRRGMWPIDARLDLHGMRAEEARRALEEFLLATRQRGERCVLVIHGKGEHSPHGMGVLRGEMGAWLAQTSASRHVAAFTTARPVDGGEGAIYVLLRR